MVCWCVCELVYKSLWAREFALGIIELGMLVLLQQCTIESNPTFFQSYILYDICIKQQRRKHLYFRLRTDSAALTCMCRRSQQENRPYSLNWWTWYMDIYMGWVSLITLLVILNINPLSLWKYWRLIGYAKQLEFRLSISYLSYSNQIKQVFKVITTRQGW